MTQPENVIDYIEFAVTDIERAKSFYGNVFGWTFTSYGPDYCAFSDGRMSGGFAASETVRTGGPLIVIHCADLAAAEARITAAGGRITKAAFSFPGGRRFHFTDPDGHQLAVWSEN